MTDFRRLPLLGAIVSSLQAAKQVVVTAAVVLVSGGPSWVVVLSLVGFGITTAYHVARWLTFGIWVDRNELRTSQVFITRTERRIPISSIHDLHFEQSLLQRLTGVVTVRIETAGSSGTEAELSGLLKSQADALRAAIDAARRGDQADAVAAPAEPPEQVVAELRLPDLVVAGASSATIWIVGGALLSAWFFFDDLVPGLEEKLEPFFESVATFVAGADAATLVASGAALLLVLLVVAALASIARTAVRFWNFRATWNGSRLLRSCGLFTKRRQVLHASRIQRILVRQSVLQRLCGCVVVELGTAALGSREEEDRGRSFTIPILRMRQVQPLLDIIAPGAVALDGAFEPVSPLASRRYLIRSGVLFAAVSAAIAVRWPGPAALVWILYLRNLARAPRLPKVGGWNVTPDLVQFRTGAFSRRLSTLPLRRVQGVELAQTVFDRHLGLASIHVSAAGGGNVGSLSDVPEHRARALVATILDHASEVGSRDLEKPNAPLPTPGVDSEFRVFPHLP